MRKFIAATVLALAFLATSNPCADAQLFRRGYYYPRAYYGYPSYYNSYYSTPYSYNSYYSTPYYGSYYGGYGYAPRWGWRRW